MEESATITGLCLPVDPNDSADTRTVRAPHACRPACQLIWPAPPTPAQSNALMLLTSGKWDSAKSQYEELKAISTGMLKKNADGTYSLKVCLPRTRPWPLVSAFS